MDYDTTIIKDGEKDGEEYLLKTANEGYWFCTCGTFFKNTNKNKRKISCPHCGTGCKYTRYKKSPRNFARQKILKYENYAFQVEEKSFDINMPNEEMDLDELKETLTNQLNNVITVTEIDYDFFRTEEPLKVTINGKPVESKIEKLKALENFKIEDDESLFTAVSYMVGPLASMQKVIQALLNKPKIEVFYSTYGILPVYRWFNIEDMDLTKRKPHQILGITKNMLKKLMGDGYYGLHLKYEDARKLGKKYAKKPDIADTYFNDVIEYGIDLGDYLEMLEKYGYQRKRLLKYLKEDINLYQGIESPLKGLNILIDYVRMCSDMEAPFLKYPTSLKKVHDAAVRNYEIRADEIERKKFAEEVHKPEYLSLTDPSLGDYCVLAPEKIEDVQKEGQELHHCVASYVNSISNGKTKILFMRHKTAKDKSLLTLEVRDGELLQCKGSLNRSPSNEERKFVKAYVKKKGLYWDGVA